MSRTLVAGVDSSTQSTKIVVRDADTGELVRSGRAPHPPGTEVEPGEWWAAFESAAGDGLLDGVAALSVAGQQHGLILLDDDGAVVRPALLWNDTRSADAAADLVSELGGGEAWAEAVGTVPVASITVSKLRWIATHEPANARRATTAVLPHDYLTWRLAGSRAEPTTDRGDASGTGYWSPSTDDYRADLLELAFGRRLAVPRVVGPGEVAGQTPNGMVLGAGTGDNMGAALGVHAQPGDVVISLGTSGTVFAVHDKPTSDGSAAVAGFADATGHFLPLVCTLNAARIFTATATLLGTDLDGLEALALSAPAGAEGVVLLPYFDGERTPNLPDASGVLSGLRLSNATPANVARAAVEGVLCGLADGLDALVGQGIHAHRILLVGGGAASSAVQTVAASLFEVPVLIPAPGEYVADGAARQAAWALSGAPSPPTWELGAVAGPIRAEPSGFVREAYAEARDRTYG